MLVWLNWLNIVINTLRNKNDDADTVVSHFHALHFSRTATKSIKPKTLGKLNNLNVCAYGFQLHMLTPLQGWQFTRHHYIINSIDRASELSDPLKSQQNAEKNISSTTKSQSSTLMTTASVFFYYVPKNKVNKY